MALFDKLFSLKRKLDNDYHETWIRDRSSQINSEQVRLLLFKECDWRGRKLLFDSSAIERIPSGKYDKPQSRQTEDGPCIVEVTDGFTYMYKGPAADASVLGEMIFGAVAMNYKSVSLKIHIMDEPRRLMCTKVFCVPQSRRISRVERKTSDINNNGTMRNNSSKPLNVPMLREEGVSLSFSIDRGDSGFGGDFSPYSSVGSTCDYFSMFETWDGNNSHDDHYFFHSPPGRKLSTSSNGSWQRRTFQNMSTRFDFGYQSSNLLTVPTSASNATSDSQVYSISSTSCTSESLTSSGSAVAQSKNKLGLAILITVTDAAEMDIVRKCLEHSPQLQAMVCRLRLATLAAGAGGAFVSTLHKAAEDTAKWLTDIIYGPRLQPLWLSLITSERRESKKMAESLISDLCSVLSVADTKSTNFFISTLLTHILTYHLGWVTTVSPYDTIDHQQLLSEKTNEPRRPYNALWAQLSDLCGSIGFPPRAAKTIISGPSNTQFVNKLLVVLTYFVRCGDVKRSDFQYRECVLTESKVVNVKVPEPTALKRSASRLNNLSLCISRENEKVPPVCALDSDGSVSMLTETSLKRSSTLAKLSQKLSNSSEFPITDITFMNEKPMSSQLRRNPSMMLSLMPSSDSSQNSSVSGDSQIEQNVVFVLGDDEKLIGLKNKSNGGKSVKKSSKIHNEPIVVEQEKKAEVCVREGCDKMKSAESPSKCCGQTLQHSKPIKHSGFKFEFDKYPQIVTNYMKSKNLEILDRHYIGKPGNLKLDNFQFDPTIVPPIQEERCETCVKCQMMESMLQTPTNASEMEYMNDMPRQVEPQFAKETVVNELDRQREISPKTFVRKRKENTIIVNVNPADMASFSVEEKKRSDEGRKTREREKAKVFEVKQIVEYPVSRTCVSSHNTTTRAGFESSLLGGITDHYVPDLIIQGTTAKPNMWEIDLRRDLDITSYLNKTMDSPIQSVAIVGDTNNWEVRVVGRECGTGGMSSLVGAMLDVLPAMWKAKVPAHQCLTFMEGKLREFCVLSKTLADMLMSTDFCDIATLTSSLNIDVNDVPLLMAVATTHTPLIATRYGISYR